MNLLVAFMLAAPVLAELSSFELVGRHYYPAGYAKGTTEGKPDL